MAVATAYRVQDLLDLPDLPAGEHYELSKGELIIVARPNFPHEFSKAELAERVVLYASQPRRGKMFSETLFSLGPDTARQPDVAFVSQAKLDRYEVTDETVPFAPDFVIEVVSLSERAQDAEIKVQEYFEAGVPEVWQVFLQPRLIRRRTPDSTRDFKPGEIAAAATLPGFEVPVADIYPPPVRN